MKEPELEMMLKIKAVYEEIIEQVGKLVVQDYHTLLVTIPEVLNKRIEELEKEREEILMAIE